MDQGFAPTVQMRQQGGHGKDRCHYQGENEQGDGDSIAHRGDDSGVTATVREGQPAVFGCVLERTVSRAEGDGRSSASVVEDGPCGIFRYA